MVICEKNNEIRKNTGVRNLLPDQQDALWKQLTGSFRRPVSNNEIVYMCICMLNPCSYT